MTMSHLRLFISIWFIALAASGTGCSTVRIHSQAEDLSAIRAEQSFGIRVRSGNLALDKLIHDTAYAEFGRHLPVSGNGPYTGFIDIVFTSASGTVFGGASAGFTADMAYGDNWFTGDESAWTGGNSAYAESGIAPGGIFSWQDSTMTVTLRDISNRRLWKAVFHYRGGRDITALYIKTADDAARFCLDRIIEAFEREYVPGRRPARNKATASMSSGSTVLVLKGGKSPVPEPHASSANEIPPDAALIVKDTGPLPGENPVYKTRGAMPGAPGALKSRRVLFPKAPPLGERGYLDAVESRDQ